MSLQRAFEIASKANLCDDKMSVMAELVEFYTPDKLFIDFPYVFDDGRLNTDGRRTILWSILTATAPTTERFLRPYDVTSRNPQFLVLVQMLEMFVARRSESAYLTAKNCFTKYVEEHWKPRNLLHKFNYFFLTHMLPFGGEAAKHVFEVQMKMLIDCEFEEWDHSRWIGPQFAHAVVALKFDPVADPYPPAIAHMPRLSLQNIMKEVNPFVVAHPVLNSTLTHYLNCYVSFVQSNINKPRLTALIKAFTFPDEQALSPTIRMVNFVRRVLIQLSDVASPQHNFVRSRAQIFMFELFHENEMKRLFQNEIHNICAVEVEDIHLRVRNEWDKKLPDFHQLLFNSHLSMWSCTYTNILNGL